MAWTSLPASLLCLAGALHLLQLPVTSWLARRTLQLHRDIPRLSPLNQAIVLIFIGAVSLLVLGLGVIVLLQGKELLSSGLGRQLCFVLTAFWLARAAAQVWLYRRWPSCRSERAIYFGLLGLYGILATCYATAYAAATLAGGEA